MADVMTTLGIGGMNLGGASDFLYTALKWGGVLLVLLLVFWYFYNKKQYKYDVTLNVLQNGKFVRLDTVAKIKKDETMTEFWYVKGIKQLASTPPSEAMTFSTKARWGAVGFYDREIGIMWRKDMTSEQEFKDAITDATKLEKKTGKHSRSGELSLEGKSKPFTTTQKSLLAARISRAMQRRGTDLWSRLWQILPVVILVIIFALILIFWKNIAEPITALQGANAEISKNNALMQQQNIRLYQMLTGGKGNGTSYIVQQLPSDQQYFLPAFPAVNTS